MRKPTQTRKAIGTDLKHFALALDRAQLNTRRAPKDNLRIIDLLSELVRRYTAEHLESMKATAVADGKLFDAQKRAATRLANKTTKALAARKTKRAATKRASAKKRSK